jgi:lysophospholipase L1-like esterase
MMGKQDKLVRRLETRYWLGAAALAPVAPLLLVQGRVARWKIGLLPDAAGPTSGIAGEGTDTVSLLVIGESTAAGLGARTHELALAGRFAYYLSQRIGKRVAWEVVGRAGVTARRTIDELVPLIPGREYDHILIAVAGNDVMKLTPPRRWRRDMTELIGLLRENSPHSRIYLVNCPMIKYAWAVPPPSRQLLWQLSQMHDRNARDFTADMKDVQYFEQPVVIREEGFFSDGVHPSEQGYSDWAEAMVERFYSSGEW